MQNRIKAIIDYKTGGRIGEFGALLGWSPQYISKLLRGACIGLSPVRTILEALPEINARWLILGEGQMFDNAHVSALRREAVARASSLMAIDRYIDVMTPEELRRLEKAISSGRAPAFSPSDVARWELLQQQPPHANH